MTKTTPETSVTICDCCKNKDSARLHNARLTLKRDAVDMHNVPCADASITLDLCDDCMAKIAAAVNEVQQGRKTLSPKSRRMGYEYTQQEGCVEAVGRGRAYCREHRQNSRNWWWQWLGEQRPTRIRAVLSSVTVGAATDSRKTEQP